MPNRVAMFLEAFAQLQGFGRHTSIHGRILLGQVFPLEQNVGAVYGICAVSSAPIGNTQPLPNAALVPVYWGKDVSPASRVKAHAQGHRNGNINLPTMTQVHGLELYYGAILIERYEQFEDTLRRHFPPIAGGGRRGRVGTVVRVLA